MKLKNQVAIVTGASKGIGAAIALVGTQFPLGQHTPLAYSATFGLAIVCFGLYLVNRTAVLLVEIGQVSAAADERDAQGCAGDNHGEELRRDNPVSDRAG